MEIYQIMDNDGDSGYNIICTCLSEKVTQEMLEWLNNHNSKYGYNLVIIKHETIDSVEDISKYFKKVYSITTNPDCSINKKEIFWENINYREKIFVRHWEGTGIGESNISYKDVWEKLVVEWDRSKEIFSDKFPKIDRITEYPGD
jgi:hypothetical protein